MKTKKQRIVLTLPPELKDVTVTVIRGINNKEMILGLEPENETYPEDNSGNTKYIFVYSSGSYIKLDLELIIWIEAEGSYCTICQKDKKNLLLSFPLIEAQRSLPSNFIRIHRSFLINMDYVTELMGNAIRVHNRWFTIGREYRADVFAHFYFLKINRK